MLDDDKRHAPDRVELPWTLESKRYPRRRRLGTYRQQMSLRVRRPVIEVGQAWRPVEDVHDWLTLLYELCAKEQTNAAVDLTFDGIDDLLGASELERCNEIIRGVELSSLSVRVMLSLLMATFRARSVLPERAKLYAKIDARLRAELPASKVDRLLGNLK